MADEIDALFAALGGGGGGGGDLAGMQHGIEKGLAGLAANHAVLPPDAARTLSAELGGRAHHAGSHLPQAVRGAAASRARPRYMAANATQTAHALLAALTQVV